MEMQTDPGKDKDKDKDKEKDKSLENRKFSSTPVTMQQKKSLEK
jgi:hypothetical protein